MSGLLRRIRGARGAAPDAAAEAGWGDEGAHTHAEPAGPVAGEPPLPAGLDLDALVGEQPTSRRRGRMRRRLRHLRRVREVLLRDLGGLVLEIHRSGEAGSEAHSRLVGAKLARLSSVAAEIAELQDVLADHRRMELREPGIGGSCPLCGELHGSEARFCWACGTPVAPGAARPLPATSEQVLPAIALPAASAAAAAAPPAGAGAPADPDATQPMPAIDAEQQPDAGGNGVADLPTQEFIEGSSEDIQP
jgi:hypothetical protein